MGVNVINNKPHGHFLKEKCTGLNVMKYNNLCKWNGIEGDISEIRMLANV